MNATIRLVLAGAAAVLVVGVMGVAFWPRSGGAGAPTPAPSSTPLPSPSATPMALPEGVITPGTYAVTPFAAAARLGACLTPPQAGCAELPEDDSIRLTFTVPGGWGAAPDVPLLASSNNGPQDGAIITFIRGAWLYSEPCQKVTTDPDIPVGPTVDDFANAIANHPKLDATAPVPVTLGGYSGKYLDIQGPADISQCTDNYRPWEPGIYAQGPGHRWHLWILDVDGVRVVVQSMDYAGTSAKHRAEAQAIVDSIRIEP